MFHPRDKAQGENFQLPKTPLVTGGTRATEKEQIKISQQEE